MAAINGTFVLDNLCGGSIIFRQFTPSFRAALIRRAVHQGGPDVNRV
jgi:hypothetical protein